MQPIFHTDGEPPLKNTILLAHSVPEKGTVININSWDIRCVKKNMLPGKTHSSPRYSESSHKLEYFTTDSELDSIDMSHADEESSFTSHGSRIKVSRDLSSSQGEEYVMRRQNASRAMSAGNTTEGGKTGKPAEKRRF